METDLKTIRKLAAENEEEMDEFLESLKDKKISSKRLDAAFKKSIDEASQHFDCTSCAACCKKAYVVLMTEDIARLAGALGMKRSEFRCEFVGKNEDGDTVLNRKPCPFLKGNLCLQYDARPDCCREYPHSLAVDTRENLENISANYLVCPILFNALEKLRESI